MHFSSRGQARPLEVIFMFSRLSRRHSTFTLLVSSAAPMNSPGPIRPWRGCRQRSKASAPTILPLRRSTFGW